MKIMCDVCEAAAATVVCCADEAALCRKCDIQVHAANKLAGKHQRLPLLQQNKTTKPTMCDICQEKRAFIFCVEDRALFCRDCDQTIHVAGSLSGNHQRLLATGIGVALSSVRENNDSYANTEIVKIPSKKSSIPSMSEAPKILPHTSSEFTASAWSVDEFLQLSDYECSDKRESPIGFGDLEWFTDIGVFPGQMSNESLATTVQVPEIRHHPQSSLDESTTYGKSFKSGITVKKPRIEVSDVVDDFLTVPDLGY